MIEMDKLNIVMIDDDDAEGGDGGDGGDGGELLKRCQQHICQG